LAFLVVAVTGVLLITIVVRFYTQRAFNQLVMDQNRQVLLSTLIRYYQLFGTWQNVESVFRSGAQNPLIPTGEENTNRLFEGRWEARRDLFIIADQNGVIVFGGENLKKRISQLSNNVLRSGIPITVGEKTVGWLIFSPAVERWIGGTPEGDFLIGVQRAIWISAILACGIALLLGSFLAHTMTRSLRELTEATIEIARGKLGMQVKVRSNDELGELAVSFNRMSTDLARATQARRQMTADIAHELRSPLSVLSGYAEALSDGKLPGSPETYHILYNETRQLSRLVDDLRTLSLADAGELPLNMQMIAPVVIIERVAARHAVTAEERGIILHVEIDRDLPHLNLDVDRIAQVFDNLILNAFRYTPQGGQITLKATQLGGDRVQFQVRDTGSGITPQDLPQVFDRFYRGDESRSSSGESGLGLAIAKSIVEAQGGTITVESSPGQGTVFTLTFGLKSLPELHM
jgi:signal transduction histidine kinase